MYRKNTTRGEILLFDDDTAAVLEHASIYRNGKGQYCIHSRSNNLIGVTLHTWLFPEHNHLRTSYEFINGNTRDFRRENQRPISRGDRHRGSRPREGRQYKGLVSNKGESAVVVWINGKIDLFFFTRGREWTEARRAALYNAVKDYCKLSGWRNPTDETYNLSAEQIAYIDGRLRGEKRQGRPAGAKSRIKPEAQWRRYM